MAISKPKKSPKNTKDDTELLKTDFASFASSIGLSSYVPSSGIDDSDFRKTGPFKKPNPKPNDDRDKKTSKRDKFNNTERNKNEERPKPRAPAQQPLSIDDNSKANDKFKHLPKLPLMKASVAGVWYVDAADLKEKVMGKDGRKKKVEFRNLEEWKGLVAKKKELAELLLVQYSQDYESSRGQSGDIKMLAATQRSGLLLIRCLPSRL